MNTVQTYELKKKIAQVSSVDMNSGARISDYVGNTGFVIDNSDIYTETGRISVEQIEKLKLEFKKISDKIIALETDAIIQKLQLNPPMEPGTMANIESIKQAFIH